MATPTQTSTNPMAAANDPQVDRVRRWQMFSGLAMAAAVALATVLVVRGPAAPAGDAARYVALLQGKRLAEAS